jgi:hypothetical protein
MDKGNKKRIILPITLMENALILIGYMRKKTATAIKKWLCPMVTWCPVLVQAYMST